MSEQPERLWCLYQPDEELLLKGLTEDEVAFVAQGDHSIRLWYIWQEGWSDWKPVKDLASEFPYSERPVKGCPAIPLSDLAGEQEDIEPPGLVTVANLDIDDNEDNEVSSIQDLIVSTTVKGSFVANESDKDSVELTGVSEIFDKTKTFHRDSDYTSVPNSVDQEIEMGENTREYMTEPFLNVKGDRLEQISGDEVREYVKRNHKRFPKAIPIEIECDGQLFKTISEDVSLGGVKLQDPLPYWVVGYSKVRLRNVKNRQVVELTCYIVENQRPNERYRIALLPLKNPIDEEQLENWLRAA